MFGSCYIDILSRIGLGKSSVGIRPSPKKNIYVSGYGTTAWIPKKNSLLSLSLLPLKVWNFQLWSNLNTISRYVKHKILKVISLLYNFIGYPPTQPTSFPKVWNFQLCAEFNIISRSCLATKCQFVDNSPQFNGYMKSNM